MFILTVKIQSVILKMQMAQSSAAQQEQLLVIHGTMLATTSVTLVVRQILTMWQDTHMTTVMIQYVTNVSLKELHWRTFMTTVTIQAVTPVA